MESTQFIELLLNFGLPLFLLVLGYGAGSLIERRHFSQIRKREEALRTLPAITLENAPGDWIAQESGLVTGSVVVSLDYFKRFLSGLRALIGGRVQAYETLLDRARREATIRLKESATAAGYTAVINLRIETSRLASGRRDGKGTAGVEVLAFGTGLRLQSGIAPRTSGAGLGATSAAGTGAATIPPRS